MADPRYVAMRPLDPVAVATASAIFRRARTRRLARLAAEVEQAQDAEAKAS